MKLPALLACTALAVSALCSESFAQSLPNPGNNNTSGNNTTINYKKTVLKPTQPVKGNRIPSSICVEVYQTGDILTFDITEEMGACTVFIGEREDPVETYVISCDDPCVSISGIEVGEYPLILVTEGYQIFQGTIEL